MIRTDIYCDAMTTTTKKRPTNHQRPNDDEVKPKKTTRAISISPAIVERVKEIALENDRTFSWMLQDLVRRGIEAYEETTKD